MRGGRRNNSSRRPGAVPRLAQKLNQLKIQTNGTKFTPAPTPPDFVEVPWNTYTYERTNRIEAELEDQQLLVGDIISQIRGRLNISDQGQAGTGNVIKLKILDVSGWAIASVQTIGVPDLQCRVYELNPGDLRTARMTLRDVGSLNMPAKLGYKFPVTDSKQVLSDGDAAMVIANFQTVGVDTRSTIRAHVLWKSTYTTDP